jgi:hypothetical protein
MTNPVLLLIPPLTQLNTPYPSTAYLTGFLRDRGYAAAQADLGIEMVLALFSRPGLMQVFQRLHECTELPAEARQMLALERSYLDTIEPVVRFLQGQDPSLVATICRRRFLPEGPRFRSASDVRRSRARGTDVDTDQARRLATLYLEDLADLVRETVAPDFALSRYAEQVATSASAFAPIRQALDRPPSLTDQLMLSVLQQVMDRVHPSVVGLTVPFPGNLYGALRIGQALKAKWPGVQVILGGGYVNTELRRLTDPAIFDYVDFVTLDDGERPLLCLLEYFEAKRTEGDLRRTFRSVGDGCGARVAWCDGSREPDFGIAEVGTPTYDGLPLSRYISILDTLNPMHRLWSEGHWNKLTVAHGCYWKQCTFCDVGLDYIGRYEAAPHQVLADRIEALIAETGHHGFHFVDEAAPPAGLKALALTLLERSVKIRWWGNVRFEAAFTPDLCRLLAASGCIAITAGLEAASDRLLAAMKKGITVEQTAQVAAAFRAVGILVHAYLMYGLPGETIAETVEALERVRQLFVHNLLQSAFWHRFVATAHSPIGLAPATHGIRITGPTFEGFAENDLTHADRRGGTPTWLGEGLRRALYNYMEGKGLGLDVRHWFDHAVPKPRVALNWVSRVIQKGSRQDAWAAAHPFFGERRLVWIGGKPVVQVAHRATHARLILPSSRGEEQVQLPTEQAYWLVGLLQALTPRAGCQSDGYPTLKATRADYPGRPREFDDFMGGKAGRLIRRQGLLLV